MITQLGVALRLVLVCLSVSAAHWACAQTGLVGYWPLAEGSGRAADDLSGYGNAGEIRGEAVWEDTERGQALRFNGKDTTVQIPQHPAWNIGRGEMTVAVWVKFDQGHDGAILEREFGGTPGAWRLTADSTPYWSFYDDASQSQDIRFDGFTTGQWQHLALVWKRDTNGWMRTYVNGRPSAFRQNLTCTAKRIADMYIGSMRAGYSFFKGNIKDVVIFNRCLSDAEIDRLCAQGTPVGPPVVLYSKRTGEIRKVFSDRVRLAEANRIRSSATGEIIYAPKKGEETQVNLKRDVPIGERQLFLDDQEVAWVENLRRTMHQPVKKGAVIKPDLPWETGLQTRSTPAWDVAQKVYKLWMITSGNLPELGNGGTTYAESKDGIHWTKPILRQVTIKGSAENNFVGLGPNLQWPANAMENVVYDPLDPDPARRFKGLAHCSGREPVVSADGIHWKRLNVPPIPSYDESNLSYDFSVDGKRRLFILTVKQPGPHGRSVWLSTSGDFEHWTEPRLVFHADDLDQELARKRIAERLADATRQKLAYNNPAQYNADVYNMAIFRYESRYLGLPTFYYESGKGPDGDYGGFHHVELAVSRDLWNWRRLADRAAWLETSPLGGGAYDLTCLICPSRPLVRDHELWFYYTGLKYYGGTAGVADSSAICLAVLRRDGFVSLDAGDEEGVLVTKPFRLDGRSLWVNVDATRGRLRVELSAEDGTRLVSKPITGDHTLAKVAWEKADLAAVTGKIVTLRFALRGARLYAYWIE